MALNNSKNLNKRRRNPKAKEEWLRSLAPIPINESAKCGAF